MSRVSIPVTTITRAATGVVAPASTDSDATNKHVLINNGQTWLEITSTDGGSQTIDVEQIPVDGVTALKRLTVAAGATVKWGPIPTNIYNQQAIAAAQTLTSDATTPLSGETVTINGTQYTFRTTLTETKASTTLTSDATAPANGDTVTVDAQVYTFKTTLSAGGVTANEVLIGANAAAALTNLKAAIAGTSGGGSTYGSSTVAHGTVDAGTLTATTLVLTAKTAGIAGNSIATLETSAHLSFTGATLTGGVDAIAYEVLLGGSAANALSNLKAAINDAGVAGTNYSTGTVVHSVAVATTLTSTTLVVAAQSAGASGNAYTVSETSSHLSWGAATLTDGYDAGIVCFLTPSVSTTLKLRAYTLLSS